MVEDSESQMIRNIIALVDAREKFISELRKEGDTTDYDAYPPFVRDMMLAKKKDEREGSIHNQRKVMSMQVKRTFPDYDDKYTKEGVI